MATPPIETWRELQNRMAGGFRIGQYSAQLFNRALGNFRDQTLFHRLAGPELPDDSSIIHFHRDNNNGTYHCPGGGALQPACPICQTVGTKPEEMTIAGIKAVQREIIRPRRERRRPRSGLMICPACGDEIKPDHDHECPNMGRISNVNDDGTQEVPETQAKILRLSERMSYLCWGKNGV